MHAVFLLSHVLIIFFQPFIVSLQQRHSSTTNVFVPFERGNTDPLDVSAKFATPKIARTKTTAPKKVTKAMSMQLKSSNKPSACRMLFKRVTLTLLTGADVDKDTLMSDHSTSNSFVHLQRRLVDSKVWNEIEISSKDDKKILRTNDSDEVEEDYVNYLINKLRVKRKSLQSSSTYTGVGAVCDGQCKSVSKSKVMLGKAISMLIFRYFNDFTKNAFVISYAI